MRVLGLSLIALTLICHSTEEEYIKVQDGENRVAIGTDPDITFKMNVQATKVEQIWCFFSATGGAASEVYMYNDRGRREFYKHLSGRATDLLMGSDFTIRIFQATQSDGGVYSCNFKTQNSHTTANYVLEIFAPKQNLSTVAIVLMTSGLILLLAAILIMAYTCKRRSINNFIGLRVGGQQDSQRLVQAQVNNEVFTVEDNKQSDEANLMKTRY